MEIFFKPTFSTHCSSNKKGNHFLSYFRKSSNFTFKIITFSPFLDCLIQYLNFLNSAFECSESSFSDDLHNPEQTPEQHLQVTLFHYNEMKMDGYPKIGMPSAPKLSKLLTRDQHRAPFLWRSLKLKTVPFNKSIYYS